MKQEEKIKEAKRLYESANADQRYVLESLFPELKESDGKDEKIRKALIRAFKSLNTIKVWNGIERTDIIDWLEKQGEHANFRNKIQIGDKVTRNEDGVLVNLSQLKRVAKKQGEQNLNVNDNAKEMFIKALERVEEQNNKGYKLTDCDKNSWWEDFKAYTSCIIEQKPAAWSEEDKGNLLDVKCIIDEVWHNQDVREEIEHSGEELESLWHWLDNIWQRVEYPHDTWKPRDEQVKAIKWVMDGDSPENWTVALANLYNDLKKLREE